MKQRKTTVKVRNWMELPLTRMELQSENMKQTVQEPDFTTNTATKANEERKIETNIILFT